MDWANEDYVKVYTRVTDDDLLLSWQALALWRAMLVRFDRSGLIETRRGLRGLAALVHIPLEVVEPAMAELLEDGRITQTPTGYFAPNFMEAQETSKSDKNRQKESRMRRADRARYAQSDSSPVIKTTECHSSSQPVTPGHAGSQDVTLSSALLCDPNPLLCEPLLSEAPRAPVVVPVDAVRARAFGRLAESMWSRVSEARVGEAARLGMVGVLPFAPITPAHQPKGFDELRERLREEGDNAAAVCEHVLRILVEQARDTKSIEWLSEKSFLEGSWRTAREGVPGAPRAGPGSANARNSQFQVPGIRKTKFLP